MVRVFFLFSSPFYSLLLFTPKFLHHHLVTSSSSSTMFSAQAQNSASTLATTFLTGYGCANNNTNATTSSSSSSRTRAFFSLTKRQTPKRIIIANVGKATASNVSRNPNMGQLQAGYLFPEIARIRNAHLEKNPDAKIISLGIGDTTVRFYARRTTTKSALFFSLLSLDFILSITCREIGVTLSSFLLRASARAHRRRFLHLRTTGTNPSTDRLWHGKCGVGVRHGRWVRKDRRVRLGGWTTTSQRCHRETLLQREHEDKRERDFRFGRVEVRHFQNATDVWSR